MAAPAASSPCVSHAWRHILHYPWMAPPGRGTIGHHLADGTHVDFWNEGRGARQDRQNILVYFAHQAELDFFWSQELGSLYINRYIKSCQPPVVPFVCLVRSLRFHFDKSRGGSSLRACEAFPLHDGIQSSRSAVLPRRPAGLDARRSDGIVCTGRLPRLRGESTRGEKTDSWLHIEARPG